METESSIKTIILHRLRIQACFVLVGIWGAEALRNRRTSRREFFVLVWKGGFMLTYFYVRIIVPMSYLKLWNFIYTYIYIYVYTYRPSVPSSPSSVLCNSVRPSRPSRRRRRTSSVRPGWSLSR